MRIALVCPQFYPSTGGIENDIYDTAQRLMQRGHDVTVITSNLVNYKPRKLPQQEAIDGITVRRFAVIPPYPLSKLILTLSLIKGISSIRADIFYVTSFLPYFLTNYIGFYAARKKIPLIIFPVYHPDRQHAYRGLVPFLVTTFYDRWLGLKLLKRANFIMTCTDSEMDYYKREGIKNVSVRGNAIEPEQEGCGAKELGGFIQKYQLSENTLLCLQRLEPRKGVQHVIRALPLVLERYPDAKLLVAGNDCGYQRQLEKLCLSLGVRDSVVFSGNLNRKEVSCALEASKLLLLLSHYETFGIVILEAWDHKKPVIVSNAGAFKDFVSPETGLVVNKEEPAEVAIAIIKLLSQPALAESLGVNGYRLVRERFTWDKVIEKMGKVFEDISSKVK